MNNNQNQLNGYRTFPTGLVKEVPFWGSALSTFQQSPRDFIGISDWGREVEKSDQKNIPNFLRNYQKYLDVSQFLGQNIFRISLEISHLCPKLGEFNETVMAKYIEIILNIKMRGLEPMVTLFHWTLPAFFTSSNKQSAWEHPDLLKHFHFYIQRVSEYLQNKDNIRSVIEKMNLSKADCELFLGTNLVRYFISINEPSTYNLNSFLVGVFPPNKRLCFGTYRSQIEKWAIMHDMAYEKFGEHNNNGSKIGVAHNWTYFGNGPVGKIFQYYLNEKTLNIIERTTGNFSDFFTLQYYCRLKIIPYLMKMSKLSIFKAFLKDYDFGDHPGFGDIYPHGIYENLKRIHEMYPKKELWITEFGFVDNLDKNRPHFIFETVNEILSAVRDGIAIKGVLLWSLVNNFEWDQGMRVALGLFNENELFQQIRPSYEGIRSWQVWKVILSFRDKGNIRDLEDLMLQAYNQYISDSSTNLYFSQAA